MEGPTLADRISKGPIPVDEALPIAKQIAEALEAAHEAGVIHRDLKPANNKVRDDDTVKVLDFGLAKALDLTPKGDPSQSPTLTAAATQMGVVMGTAAYMSPEQAKGKVADKRADVWAFGCVLYEMLTGRRAFTGDDISEVLARVIKSDPNWDALPSDVPLALRSFLRRCVQKEAKQRVRDIDDVRLAMEGAFETMVSAPSDTIGAVWQRSVSIAVAVLASLAVGGIAVWTLMRPAPPPQPITRFPVVLPPDQQLSNPGRHQVAVSPDGTHLAYVANQQLYLRAMEQLEATPIRGTDGGRGPFFSPDGQSIGFWQSGQLKRVSLTGGAPVALCDADNPLGASWGPDNTVLFGQSAGIARVSGAGGTSEVLIAVVEGGERARQPQALPGGEAVIFTLSAGTWDQGQIVAQSLETGERRVLVDGGTDARYLPTGHVVYAQGGTLFAVPFDVARLEVTGGPVSLVDEVAVAGSGAAQFTVSRTGTLAYVPERSTSGAVRTLVWVDRDGREDPPGGRAACLRVSAHLPRWDQSCPRSERPGERHLDLGPHPGDSDSAHLRSGL